MDKRKAKTEAARQRKKERNLAIYRLSFQGYTHQQIANEIGCCLRTVSRVLNKKCGNSDMSIQKRIKASRKAKIRRLFQQGKSYKEVAEIMGCSASNALRYKPKSDDSGHVAEARRLLETGSTKQEIAEALGCSVRTVYRLLDK